MCGLFGVAAMTGAVVLLITGWPWGPAWLGWGLTIAAGLWFLFMLLYVRTDRQSAKDLLLLFAGYGLYDFATHVSTWLDDLEDFLFGSMVLVGPMLSTALPLLVGAHYLGWPVSIALTVLVPAFAAVLNWYGVRRERATRNLFVGLLQLDETARRRTSVIAK
jgi:hypothetical protein